MAAAATADEAGPPTGPSSSSPSPPPAATITATTAAAASSSSFKALGVGLIAACGLSMALQSGVNSTLGHHVGRAFAAVVSFATGLAAVAIFFAIEVTAMGVPPPTLAAAKAAPWWSWFGGPLGAFYVAVVVVFARAVGATTLSGVFVSSLLAWSFALDLIGVAGFPRRAFSWPRLLGLLLMIAGVVLVTVFPGEVLGRKEQEQGGGVGSGAIGREGSRAQLLLGLGAGGRRSLAMTGSGLGSRPPVARSYSSVVLPRLG